MVVFLGTACGEAGDRAAREEDPLEREFELALPGDTGTAVFEDTAIVAPPAAEPEPERRPGRRVEAPARDPAPPREPVRVQPERTVPPPPEPVVEAKPEPVVRTAVLTVGTTMKVTLDEELSTQTSLQGDVFTATLDEPVYSDEGGVIVPGGAKVRGRVTHVQKSGRVGETAVLNVAFEAISWDGASYPLDAAVVQANPERVSRASTGEQVGKVAAGAAAGAILGRVLGSRNRDAVKGAVIGAAAGTAIALGTADVDAVLKAGSVMVIRVDQPVTVTLTN
jgi:hypothetical protein